MYTDEDYEELLEDLYTETEMREIETIYVETESKAHKRFQRSSPYQRHCFARQRSISSDLRYGGIPRQS